MIGLAYGNKKSNKINDEFYDEMDNIKDKSQNELKTAMTEIFQATTSENKVEIQKMTSVLETQLSGQLNTVTSMMQHANSTMAKDMNILIEEWTNRFNGIDRICQEMYSQNSNNQQIQEVHLQLNTLEKQINQLAVMQENENREIKMQTVKAEQNIEELTEMVKNIQRNQCAYHDQMEKLLEKLDKKIPTNQFIAKLL